MGLGGTLGRIGAGVATGGLSELYYNDKLRGYLGQPARGGGEYEGVDKNNFINPAYEQANQGLNNFANNLDKNEFRQGQSQLANMLMGQARGENSFSAEKLRQDTARMQGMQQSMAASAGTANKAMALRNAQANAGQLGVGMAGQAALAGIQERTAAANAASGLMQGARGQDINAYLGAQQQLGQNYSNQLQGTMGYEQNRTQRYGAAMGTPTYGEMALGGLTGAGGLLAKSDKNLKEDIKPVKHDLHNQLIKRTEADPQSPDVKYVGLSSTGDNNRSPSVRFSRFKYRDETKLPQSKYVGPMAQDIEKVAPQAVLNTNVGKVVDYNKVPLKELTPGLTDTLVEAKKAPEQYAGVKLAPGLHQRVMNAKDALGNILQNAQVVRPSNVADMSRGSLQPAIEQVEELSRPQVMVVRRSRR